MHFEELELGGEWTTRRRTISEADLAAYIGLSGDLNPLYADAEHARAGHWGGVVVPGALVSAVVMGLGAIDAPVPATVGLVGMSWKYLEPVRPGDSVGARWRLNRKRDVENPRWGLAAWQVDVLNQRAELVAVAEVVRLVQRQQPDHDREQAEERPEGGRGGRRRRRRRGSGGQSAQPEPGVEQAIPQTPGWQPPSLPAPAADLPEAAPPAPPPPVVAVGPEPADPETATVAPAPRARVRRGRRASPPAEPAAEAEASSPFAARPPAPEPEVAAAPAPRSRRRRTPATLPLPLPGAGEEQP